MGRSKGSRAERPTLFRWLMTDAYGCFTAVKVWRNLSSRQYARTIFAHEGGLHAASRDTDDDRLGSSGRRIVPGGKFYPGRAGHDIAAGENQSMRDSFGIIGIPLWLGADRAPM